MGRVEVRGSARERTIEVRGSARARTVEFERVSFAHASGRTLFSALSFRLPVGVTALIGENGAGKSTLLRLITGELAPETGTVRRREDLRIAYCDERLQERSESVGEFASSDASEAHRLRVQLGVLGLEAQPWHALSPGQRRRFQLGAALFAEPDLLLLDEPSNHIDEEARGILIGALARFRGDTLVVSHDRALIDAVATRTWQLTRTGLRSYEGGYSAARAAIELERASLCREKDARTKEARREKRLLDDARRNQAAADHARSTRARMKGAKDIDARSMGAGVVAGWAEARAGRSVAVQRQSAERAQARAAALHVDKPLGRKLHAAFEPCPRAHVVELHRERLGYGDHVLLRDLQLVLERTARVRIEGANGAGKTTLLRALHGAVREAERVLYVPQEFAKEAVHERLEQLRALERRAKGRVLEVLAALGVEPEHVLASRAPSAGETRKLWLAWGLGRGAHALFLDEPTNDLDLPSIERLEQALADYPGALVVITHDPHFAEATLRERWCIEGGRLQRGSAL